jgi:superoxide reductase
MSDPKEFIQSADWKREKHVPVIEAPGRVKKGEYSQIKVTIGKEISHPNKTEHHISGIEVYFHPEGEKFSHLIGKAEFGAHGASTQGPDTSTIYTHHEVIMSFKTDKPGTLIALSMCNIHGLWQNTRSIEVEPAAAELPAKNT